METDNSGFCKIHTIIKLIEGACWRCERNSKAILN